jgi:hypothetical protein
MQVWDIPITLCDLKHQEEQELFVEEVRNCPPGKVLLEGSAAFLKGFNRGR